MLNFSEILLYGGTPQLHAQTIFENDQFEMHTVKEMFDFEEKVRPVLLDAHLVRYAALVVDWTNYCATENFKGFYKALIENHVPFEVISRRDLNTDKLKKYKVVLLPNITDISFEEIKAIKDYNAAGGGVVLTFRTGCSNPDGTARKENPFADITGIRGPFGVETRPSVITVPMRHQLPENFYKFVKDHPIGEGTLNRLQSFTGSYAEVETEAGTAIAQALDFDYSKMHRHHPIMGLYPGHPISPLVVVNEAEGHGRVVYFAGEFDRASYTEGMPGTMSSLAQATEWAALSQPPVEFSVSSTVETATHFSPKKNTYTIMLVNKTTNDLNPQKIVRHIEPVRDIKVSLKGINGNVRDVRSLAGGELEWKASGEECDVLLNRLKAYDALVIELIELES